MTSRLPLQQTSGNSKNVIPRLAPCLLYRNGTPIGSTAAAPYAAQWVANKAGSYSLTARATDDKGKAAASAALHIVVNAPPTASITANAPPSVNLGAPADGAVGADIALSASANDSDGNIVKVEFYQGTALVGTATQAPFNANWSNVPPGSYSLSAIAYDNNGGQTASAPVMVIVDALPQVTLSATPQGSAIAPATVSLSANATDSDGQVTGVDFYQGTTLIGSSGQPPYTFTCNQWGQTRLIIHNVLSFSTSCRHPWVAGWHGG